MKQNNSIYNKDSIRKLERYVHLNNLLINNVYLVLVKIEENMELSFDKIVLLKNHGLEFQTMWRTKKKNSAITDNAIKPYPRTFETSNGTSSYEYNVAQIYYDVNDSTNYYIQDKCNNTKSSLCETALQEVAQAVCESQIEAKDDSNRFVKLKDNTIKCLLDYGIDNLPMMAIKGHVRENILTESEAKKLGYSTNNRHYHGLGVMQYLKIVESIDNPIAVYQYTEKGKYSENNFIVLTPIERDGKKAIVPIETNKIGQYNNVELSYNKIKSSYFKDNTNYIDNLLNEGKIKEIFAGSNSQRTSLTDTNVSQNHYNVNDSTNYYIQDKCNNTKSSLCETALQEVADIINQTRNQSEKDSRQFIKLKYNTIKALVDYGIKDLPMLERNGHVRENILTEAEAKKLGYSIKNKHYHGLGIKTYLEIIDSMDNPIAVYQYTDKGKYSEDNFIVLTPVDVNGVKAIVPIEINQRGQYNQVEIDYNKIKTTYSKDSSSYINNLLKEGKIKEIFTGSNSQQTSLTDTNVSQNHYNVNDSTKYYILDAEDYDMRINEDRTIYLPGFINNLKFSYF